MFYDVICDRNRDGNGENIVKTKHYIIVHSMIEMISKSCNIIAITTTLYNIVRSTLYDQ